MKDESIREDAFFQSKDKRYLKEIKLLANYGFGSQGPIYKKHGIYSTHQLQQLNFKYNGHEELKASGMCGFTIMAKGRKKHLTRELKLFSIAYLMNI